MMFYATYRSNGYGGFKTEKKCREFVHAKLTVKHPIAHVWFGKAEVKGKKLVDCELYHVGMEYL